MRIQKYISQCGVCSRRAAEEKILDAAVTVNGEIAQIGQDIDPEKDKVAIDGVMVKGIVSDKIVLAMNKPKGYLCSNDDPFEAKTVFDLLPAPFNKMKLFCCGRLDKNSQGLLILTNDGELANKITHPSSGIIKRYRVLLNRTLDTSIIPILTRGVVSEGEKLRAYKIIPHPMADSSSEDSRRAEVWLSQGRKREIRRMFEVMGYFVKELKRFQIGSFVLRKIPEGAVKVLTKSDIEKILRNPAF